MKPAAALWAGRSLQLGWSWVGVGQSPCWVWSKSQRLGSEDRGTGLIQAVLSGSLRSSVNEDIRGCQSPFNSRVPRFCNLF